MPENGATTESTEPTEVQTQSATPADVAGVMADLFDVLATGAFTQTPDEKDCTWCRFGSACDSKPRERAAVKIANDANRVLATYRRLSERE